MVESVEPLRIPSVDRVHCRCGETVLLDIELHERAYYLREGEKAIIKITKSKEECLEYEFCGMGYVVSKKKIGGEGEYHRVVISIGGLLLVIKSSDKSLIEPLELVGKYYIGIKRVK